MKDDLVVVPCPPLADYPEAPKDQSESELFDCPKCKEKMWLSQKKKGVLTFASCLNRDILLACYNCITKLANTNPEIILGSKKVDL